MKPVADEYAATLAAEATGAAASAPSGAVLAGRYRLLEHVGSGGMGTVYKAHDQELDELVALKTLRRDLIDAEGALERFRRELKLARRVTHRSVARAFDLGEHEGEKFITMELVGGSSLGRLLRERGTLPVAESIQIAIQIADGLAAAHAADVVHRDLKPDNVLLEGERVVITDFGVARVLAGGDVRVTQAGRIIGTPAYMAPEQVRGTEVDGRTDLYALGTLLFEMICGELPYEAETPLAMAAVRMMEPPRDLAQLAPHCPPALTNLVKRALSHSLEDRFDSAATMRDALAAIQADAISPLVLTPPRHRLAAPERRIAVMPFRAAGAAEDAWMAEGLDNDLIDALSLVRGVRVRAHPDARRADEDLAAYGRRLDVEAIVEGSVRRAGEGVRAMLRLVSTSDGFHLWAQRFDAPIGDILRVSDEAARAIAAALAGTELCAPARPAPSPEVVEIYLRAKRGSEISLRPQIELFERALALAPDDPTILAGFASKAALWSFAPGERDLGQAAFDAAQKAMALAPAAAEPYVALAHVLRSRDDFVGAMRAALRAKANGPGSAEADDLIGRMLSDPDALGEAAAHLSRALWIDPTLSFARLDVVRIHALLGNSSDALRGLEELRVYAPAHWLGLSSRLMLWDAAYEGVSIVTSERAPPTVKLMSDLALEVREKGVVGDRVAAQLDSLCSSVPPRSRARRFFRQLEAEIYAYVGDAERAMRAIRDAVDAGLRDLAWMRRCPPIRQLEAQPGFDAALATATERAEAVLEVYRAEAAPILPAPRR